MVSEPLRGWRRVAVTAQHTKLDVANQLKQIVDEDYPLAEKVVLVTDNLTSHSIAALYERFAPAEARRIAEKLEWHYTPEHGSWLNMAEIEFAALQRQCLNRRIPDKETLQREIFTWIQARNAASVVINWHFTASDARIKLRSLYPHLDSLPNI
jgi:transposase